MFKYMTPLISVLHYDVVFLMYLVRESFDFTLSVPLTLRTVCFA